MFEPTDDADRAASSPGPKTRVADCRGSILLFTVVLLSLLSVLFLVATNTVLLGTRVRESLLTSIEMFYVAEAGLSHGRAFCAEQGEDWFAADGTAEEGAEAEGPEIEVPFGAWLPFGNGEYRLQAYRLSTDSQPFVKRDSGILLVVTARLHGEGSRRACLLLEEPPSCRTLAWWEPD